MINSPHQDLFSSVPYLCSSIKIPVNTSNKMLSVDQSLMSPVFLVGCILSHHDADVTKMSSSIRIPSCTQPLRNLYDEALPLDGHYRAQNGWGSIRGVIWGSESSFMTRVCSETIETKVREGINISLIPKCMLLMKLKAVKKFGCQTM